jgi:hypothetical protein
VRFLGESAPALAGELGKEAEGFLNDPSLLSRLEMLGAPLPIDPVAIDAVIEDVVDSFRNLAKQR